MIRQSARTGRTCSTSRSQREVIQAQGHSGSNQNGTSWTSSTRGASVIVMMGTVQSPCGRARVRRSVGGLHVEQPALDRQVVLGGATGDLDQGRKAAEPRVFVRGGDEPEED